MRLADLAASRSLLAPLFDVLAVFREANESIAAKARELQMEPPIPFLCECSDRRCFARIPLTIDEYEEARAGPQRYLTTSGHRVDGALIIAQDEHFALAEKR